MSYRQMRRKEQDRLARMDTDYQRRKEIAEFNIRREERMKAAEERSAKKRLKRQKKKQRKKEKKSQVNAQGGDNLKEESSDDDDSDGGDENIILFWSNHLCVIGHPHYKPTWTFWSTSPRKDIGASSALRVARKACFAAATCGFKEDDRGRTCIQLEGKITTSLGEI
ncbi:hypothetical protein ACLOJK_003814 [Asimina triloba]